jgi:hypothetical protein
MPTVLDCTHSAPSPRPLSPPDGPATAASTASPSASMVSRMPAPSAASAGVEATAAPRSASGSARSLVRFHTRRPNPAARRLCAMPVPMVPVPSSAMVSFAMAGLRYSAARARRYSSGSRASLGWCTTV